MINLDDLKREAYSVLCVKQTIDKGAVELAIDYLASRGVIPQWQPIETAPEDGLPILVTGKNETPCVVTRTVKVLAEDGYSFYCYHTQVPFHKNKFTHWMQLPPPPKGVKND